MLYIAETSSAEYDADPACTLPIRTSDCPGEIKAIAMPNENQTVR